MGRDRCDGQPSCRSSPWLPQRDVQQDRHDSPNYQSSFHDVVANDNSIEELDASNHDVEVDGYASAAGFDETTGYGSPKVDGIVGRLIALTSAGDGVAAIAA